MINLGKRIFWETGGLKESAALQFQIVDDLFSKTSIFCVQLRVRIKERMLRFLEWYKRKVLTNFKFQKNKLGIHKTIQWK